MMDQLTTILDEDGVDQVIAQVLRGMEPEILERTPVEYRCACSEQRVLDAIKSCGDAEVRDMVEEGEPIEVSCQFCDRVYTFPPARLAQLLETE